MSFTATFLPILAALQCGGNFIQMQQPWQAVNEEQKTFLTQYYTNITDLAHLNSNELKSRASLDVNQINQFLADHHFNIKLDEGPQGSVYVASILEILVQWIEKGLITQITCNDQNYPAVELKNHYSIFQSPAHPHEIIEIKTQSNDYVYMTIADTPLESFALFDAIQKIMLDRYIFVTNNFSSIIFPMVDLNHKVNINWLIGMHTIGIHPLSCSKESCAIAQALQQTKFQMNEEGAAAQSAAAIGIRFTAFEDIKPPLIIDKPFYLWIIRDGIFIPLFAGYIDTIDWKKPAKLGN